MPLPRDPINYDLTKKNPTPKTCCLEDEICMLVVPPQIRCYVTISASSSTAFRAECLYSSSVTGAPGASSHSSRFQCAAQSLFSIKNSLLLLNSRSSL